MTLDVNQFSGWLNAFAPCRVEGRAADAGRGVGLEAGSALGSGDTSGALHSGVLNRRLWGARGTRGAHEKHPSHVRDAKGVPVGYVCIEGYHVGEEVAHVGDA